MIFVLQPCVFVVKNNRKESRESAKSAKLFFQTKKISQIFAELISLVIFVLQPCVFVVKNKRKELREFAKSAKRFFKQKSHLKRWLPNILE